MRARVWAWAQRNPDAAMWWIVVIAGALMVLIGLGVASLTRPSPATPLVEGGPAWDEPGPFLRRFHDAEYGVTCYSWRFDEFECVRTNP